MKKELFKESCKLFNQIRKLERNGGAGTAEHRKAAELYRWYCEKMMSLDLYGQYTNYLKRRI